MVQSAPPRAADRALSRSEARGGEVRRSGGSAPRRTIHGLMPISRGRRGRRPEFGDLLDAGRDRTASQNMLRDDVPSTLSARELRAKHPHRQLALARRDTAELDRRAGVTGRCARAGVGRCLPCCAGSPHPCLLSLAEGHHGHPESAHWPDEIPPAGTTLALPPHHPRRMRPRLTSSCPREVSPS